MGHVILVTGPARSGKSEWAERLADRSGKRVVYIATANLDPDDPEWCDRIRQHQQRRPSHWITQAVPIDLANALSSSQPDDCLLVDSLGTWLANLIDRTDADWQDTLATLLDRLTQTPADVIFVAEETGWGVVPAYPIGRTFRDRLGTLTRKIATIAETTYLVTAGHALNLSQLGHNLDRGVR